MVHCRRLVPANADAEEQCHGHTIDGGTYYLIKNTTTGTAGSNACNGSVSSWTQMWSVRSTAHTCGTITVSDHFAASANQGWSVGNVSSIHINVEVGGGTGSIDFPTEAYLPTTEAGPLRRRLGRSRDGRVRRHRRSAPRSATGVECEVVDFSIGLALTRSVPIALGARMRSATFRMVVRVDARSESTATSPRRR